MDPITLGLIMAGVGAAKSQLIDKPKEKKQRELAARTQELSPWTGLRAGPIEEADLFGSAMQGFTGGASMGMGLEAGKYGSMRDKAIAASVLKGNNPWAAMKTTQVAESQPVQVAAPNSTEALDSNYYIPSVGHQQDAYFRPYGWAGA